METGWWSIDYGDIEPDEITLEHIAELIKQGYTNGEIIQGEEEEESE